MEPPQARLGGGHRGHAVERHPDHGEIVLGVHGLGVLALLGAEEALLQYLPTARVAALLLVAALAASAATTATTASAALPAPAAALEVALDLGGEQDLAEGAAEIGVGDVVRRGQEPLNGAGREVDGPGEGRGGGTGALLGESLAGADGDGREPRADQAVIGLSRSFPHLEGLSEKHFDGTTLTFERGRGTRPNPGYDAELVSYQAEVARREAEDADVRKRHLLTPPSKTKTAWAPHGVSLTMVFHPYDPAAPPGVRAAAGFLQPGYEAIQLQRFGVEEEATLARWTVTLRIDGDDIEELTTSLHDVLWVHRGS